ncbi:MAG: nickel pincer cofactor biosynthesis protein LarC [Sporolactobacillus sp.]
MKLLYFDCFSGISGDMILGTLIDLGLDPAYLTDELKKLHLDGYSIVYSQKVTGGIVGSDVDVRLEHPEFTDGHHSAHHHHRNLKDCQSIINMSSLSEWVKKQANQVFAEVAHAEAHVHGKPVEEVHFHEVGAVDSIIDIVGAFIGLEKLGVEKIYASTLHDGHGFINCAHGRMPVPVPAVAQMLASSSRNIPYEQGDISTELITPTGMAIIKTIAADFGLQPSMHLLKIGYGTGKRDTGGMNALRGILGEQVEATENDQVALLEANIDNQTGEVLGYVMNRLLGAGALDVFYTPIYMKKNRPAIKLSVLAAPTDQEKMIALILAETTTLGVRISRCPRFIMNREIVKVQTEYGMIHVKHASRNEIDKWSPEFDDCAFLAQEYQVPLAKIYEEAEHSIHLFKVEREMQENQAKR